MSPHDDGFLVRPIARVRSDFGEKFGVPRQAGLVPELAARIEFEPAFRDPSAVDGLDGFSHIWLVWVFSLSQARPVPDPRGGPPTGPVPDPGGGPQTGPVPDPRGGPQARHEGPPAGTPPAGLLPDPRGGPQARHEGTPPPGTPLHWSPTVRPPRLGGSQRVGVFATRSPFRPNPIGLSSVRLERIELDPRLGPVLHVRGADLVDGTPILDIKPYVPADAHPDARVGFVGERPHEPLAVSIPPELLACIPEPSRAALAGVLAQDPRPPYQDDPERVYGMAFAGRDVRFRVVNEVVTVVDVVG